MPKLIYGGVLQDWVGLIDCRYCNVVFVVCVFFLQKTFFNVYSFHISSPLKLRYIHVHDPAQNAAEMLKSEYVHVHIYFV